MRLHSYHSERGQSLVIVTLLSIALIGMLAIVLDGGYAYLQRRVAQNAADAGALAGAREWCITKNADLAVARALEYAVDRNGAVEADASLDSGEVTVNTRIPFQTAFARVFGQPEMTAVAEAVAGCFYPSMATGVLPVAWSCRAGQVLLPDGRCNMDYNQTFIIMDSSKITEDHCAPLGLLDCDTDDDGFNDMLRGGDRSWLDLSGKCGGGSCLPDWITNGLPFSIEIHTWFPGQTGDPKPIYDAAKTRQGQIVLLPTFDLICQGDPATDPACGFHYSLDKYPPDGGCSSGQWCYHVIGFSAFVIDCVSRKPGETCPEKTLAVDAGILDKQDSTIEGHFVEGGFVPGLGGKTTDGVDMGLYTLYLTR